MTGTNRERVDILDFPELDGLQLMKAHYRRQRFRRHSHEQYGFGVIERGTLCFRYLGIDHRASAGLINLVCPGECHDGHGETTEGWSYRMFYFDAELMEAIISDNTDKHGQLPFFRTGVIEDPALAVQLLHTHQYITEQRTDNLALEESIYALITRFVSVYGEEKLNVPTVPTGTTEIGRAVEILEDEFKVNHRLESLALTAGISKYHFLRVFKKTTGLTPHRYLNQIRVQRSEQMLREGVDLSEIAYRAGFSDQSHFTRTFKSIKGITPGAFRNFVQDVDDRLQ